MHNNISVVAHQLKLSKLKFIKQRNNITENIFSLNIVWKNIFPYRPDEAAMLGCESLSTQN